MVWDRDRVYLISDRFPLGRAIRHKIFLFRRDYTLFLRGALLLRLWRHCCEFLFSLFLSAMLMELDGHSSAVNSLRLDLMVSNWYSMVITIAGELSLSPFELLS